VLFPHTRVKFAKTGHGPHSSTLVVICVVRFLFVLFCILFVCKCVLPPGDNQIGVNKYIISYKKNSTGFAITTEEKISHQVIPFSAGNLLFAVLTCREGCWSARTRIMNLGITQPAAGSV
jgi:hypothetical protein